MIRDNHLNSEPSCSIDSFTILDVGFDQFGWIISKVNERSFVYRPIIELLVDEMESNSYRQTLSDNQGLSRLGTLANQECKVYEISWIMRIKPTDTNAGHDFTDISV
jgi:hypothetical protein